MQGLEPCLEPDLWFALAERLGVTLNAILDMTQAEFLGWLDHFKKQQDK